MPEVLRVLAPLVVALLGTLLVAVLGSLRPRVAAPLAVASAAMALVAALAMPAGASVDLSWAPTWGLRLSFAADGLARLYALLATGIGLAVLVYAAGYMPRHLAHAGHGPERAVRLYSLILLFMTAMLGLVLAQDLVLLIVFWDLTAITSYFLIGYEQEEEESRQAALTALLVTGISAILLILAGVILFVHHGTASIPAILARSEAGPIATASGVLIAVAALAKSAQVPLHFWLPRAMVAPTPVSAYLHSAAMVAAGVFLLGRVHPLIALSPPLRDGLVVVGFASMAVGGGLALAQVVLKRLLAYSTVAQYGYVVVLLGLGEVAGAAFYILAHALVKSALFMAAGAVTEATGQEQLDRLGGLGRALPGLAVGSGLAAAGLAGLPLTAGFFKDEVFFAGAAARGGPIPILAVAGAALTFAYTWRFWAGIFLGARRGTVQPLPLALTAPVLLLGLLVALGGIVPAVGARLAAAAGESMALEATPLALAYHLDRHAPNLMAVTTWALGMVAIVTAARWARVPRAIAAIGERYGPDRSMLVAIDTLTRFSRRLRAFEVQSLQRRIATILVSAAILVGATIVLAPPWPTFTLGDLPASDWPLVLFLVLAALAGLLATRSAGRATLVLALSAVGYSLAAVFTFIGAPDVALVAVLIETMMTVLLLGVLSLVPRDVAEPPSEPEPRDRYRSRAVGFVAAAFAFVVSWSALSWSAPDATMASAHIDLAPAAHADDVVTAILADFRGLDTLGEITVIAIALLGVLTFFVSEKST
ncbi:MAG: proton-conducting transporter membrane subunit [Sphaerobacter sp.]|nr:proton-conducting transporter membrane subunit [Sphaerobacter sp.]